MSPSAPIDLSRYVGKLMWVMLSACAARFSAERLTSEAWSGFILCTVAILVCAAIRTTLSRRSDASGKLKRAGDAIALIGLLLFLLHLNLSGIISALLTLLLVAQLAMLMVADKRIHLLLILAAAFANLLFAAAESRSALFLICAAWFTLASLSLLSFDVGSDREASIVVQAIDTQSRRSGRTVFAMLVITIAVPVYLLLPKPAGLMLGGMKAQSAHDYREQQDVHGDKGSSDATDAGFEDTNAPDSVRSRIADPKANDGESEAQQDHRNDQYNFDVTQVQRNRALANDIVMYVKSAQPVNLRGKIYERFAGNRWYRDSHDAQRRELVDGNWERDKAPGSTPITQTVEVIREIDSTLVHAPGLSKLRFPAPSIREYDDGVFELPRSIQADTTYSVESRVDVFDGRYVDVSPKRLLMTNYLLIPPNVSDRVRELAQKVTSRAESTTAKAIALEDYLRSNYEYSYDTIQYQGYTPIDWFLFEGRRGHCEYFASALAIMLRSVGIPSRLATGFSLGERNPITGYYEVRTMNGHAWVEAYVPDRGWLMLEPTPFYALPTPKAQSQVAAELDSYLEVLAQQTDAVDPHSLRATIVGGVRDAWVMARRVSKQSMLWIAALGWWLPLGLILALVASLGVYLVWQRVLDKRSNEKALQLLQCSNGALVRNAVLDAATALEVVSEPRGFERRSSQTMRQHLEHLHRSEPDVPIEFADAFEIARYSDDSPIVTDEISRIAALVRRSIATNPTPRYYGTLKGWRAWMSILKPNR